MSSLNCDIFCKVIDNYGDIGVCWRLARQLVAEHDLAVRLWVDDLAVFAHLDARIDARTTEQSVAGVCICPWHKAIDAQAADIVIEAFACDPPDAYIAAMAARPQRPAWINLEYLTAEAWAAGSHGLPSPHPRLPLVKHFFFPGFTPDTGGLLREAALLDDLQTFKLDRSAQQAFWSKLLGEAGAQALSATPSPETGEGSIEGREAPLNISLFAYENAALPGLLDAWATGEREIFCAVTAGRHVPQVRAWAESAGRASARQSPFTQPEVGLKPGLRIGRLRLAFLPFLSQADYDRLLAACDLNFVRGEDSFVRAQWAGQPFVWHIYQQEEGAHLAKLTAFLDLHCATLSPAESQALRGFWQAWEDEEDAGGHWPALLAALPALQTHAGKWTQNLVTHADLASKLLIFCKNLLECRAL